MNPADGGNLLYKLGEGLASLGVTDKDRVDLLCLESLYDTVSIAQNVLICTNGNEFTAFRQYFLVHRIIGGVGRIRQRNNLGFSDQRSMLGKLTSLTFFSVPIRRLFVGRTHADGL